MLWAREYSLDDPAALASLPKRGLSPSPPSLNMGLPSIDLSAYTLFVVRESRITNEKDNAQVMPMNLKPQDIVFLLKLIAIGDKPWSFNKLALELSMSPSEVHGSAQRSLTCKLAINQDGRIVPHARNLLEFLKHGIQYVFVPELGGMTRGLPTAHSAPQLDIGFAPDAELPSVWPDPDGEIRGVSFSPLYKSVPAAAKADAELYELLALVDCIRAGQAREKNWAIKYLEKRLSDYGASAKSES